MWSAAARTAETADTAVMMDVDVGKEGDGGCFFLKMGTRRGGEGASGEEEQSEEEEDESAEGE